MRVIVADGVQGVFFFSLTLLYDIKKIVSPLLVLQFGGKSSER